MIRNIFSVIVIMSLLVLCLLVSCKKDSDTSAANGPVVEGYLIPGQPISVKVYEQKGLTDTANYGALITGLQLKVSDGTQTVQLTESTKGTYTYSNTNFLATGKTYTLEFTYQGTTVSASTQMPGKPVNFHASHTTINLPPTSAWLSRDPGSIDTVAVAFTWSNPDSLYHVLSFKNDETDPASTHVNYDLPINFTINNKQDASYNMYTLAFNYSGTYRVILFRVNKEYSDALTSNANTTSQKLTNPPTNIKNGFGIFTAMQADTIALTVTQN